MKRDLWLRLRQYHFTHLVPERLVDHVAAAFGGADASTKAFAAKIARKLGWKTSFAVRAIEEYKKFVYLGITSDFSVTPPKVIDQVWHEHLLFSRAYREFCRDVLGRDFDHNPELVPMDVQTDVFQAQYEATLARYAEEFNMAPPHDIWGKSKFGPRTPERVPELARTSDTSTSTYDDAPLYTMFSSADNGGSAMSEFGGGGGFSGGGGESSWGDSGSSDSGSGGDSGGSSCSSSCGGGGCGGE